MCVHIKANKCECDNCESARVQPVQNLKFNSKMDISHRCSRHDANRESVASFQDALWHEGSVHSNSWEGTMKVERKVLRFRPSA